MCGQMYVQIYGNARTYRKRDNWILNEKSGQNGSCQKLKIWSRVQGHPDLSDYGLSTFRIWLYWPRIVCPYLLIILSSVQIENSSAKFQKFQTSWQYFLEWNWMGRSSDKWVQNMFTSQISNLTHIVYFILYNLYSISYTVSVILYSLYSISHIHTSMIGYTCESYFEFCKAQKVRKVHWSTYQGKWWQFLLFSSWVISYDSYSMSHIYE